MRKENRNSEGECYQVNSGVRAVYDDRKGELISLDISGSPVNDNGFYTICLQGYHFSNSGAYLNAANNELMKAGQHKVITTSAQEVLEEYLRDNQNISRNIEGRLVYR